MKKIIFLLSLVSASMLSAMYCPYEGRFLSRDPINELGFQSNAQATGNVKLLNAIVNKKFEPEYTFVNNNPVNRWDYLGLACCNGSTYDSDKQCCKDGQIQNKVKICINTIRTGRNPFKSPGHSWISTEDLNTGETNTYGSRDAAYVPAGYDNRNGSFKDIEKTQNLKPDAKKCNVICGFTYERTDSYNTLLNNCTNFAIDNWLENTGEDLANPNLGVQDPSSLYITIKYGPQPYNPPQGLYY